MPYYKKVNQNRTTGGLYSAWTSHWYNSDHKLNVLYKLNQWTYPKIKGSKLFVFDNLSDAIKFPKGNAVFECEVINVSKRGPFINRIFPYQTLLSMWTNYRNKKKYTDIAFGNPPHGTVWVDAVKLTEQIV